MSAPPAGARERTTVVLGLASALLVCGVLVWVIATQRTQRLDAGELFAQWFEARELPFGLQLAEGERLPRGDLALRFELPDAEPEPPRAVASEAAPDAPRFDWSKVPVGAADTPPREVLILQPPTSIAKDELEALFEQGEALRGDFGSVEREGGRRILDRGVLTWQRFDAAYVREREFEAGGTFRDTLRVNLSREETPCVLLARWTRGMPCSLARVEELLAALVPRS